MKPAFALVLFDLDGTLLDTRRDLAESTNHVRESFGLAPLEPASIYRLVGRGARALVERALGAERRELHDEGVRRFLAHYREHCLDHTVPYPGMRELVGALAAEGVRAAVLTNKPEALSRRILDGLAIAPALFAIVGGDTFAERKPDRCGVDRLVSAAGARREETLVVGDSAIDADTARAAEVRCCGVLWGLDPEGLAAARPAYLVRSAGELREVILRGRPAPR